MARKGRKYSFPTIIGVSDLAFILVFFFIVMGAGAQRLSVIDLPFGGPVAPADFKTTYTLEITDEFSDQITVTYNGIPTEVSVFTARTDNLHDITAFMEMKRNLWDIFKKYDDRLTDRMRTVELYASVQSYYGLIAVTIAACNQLGYKVSLRYKNPES